MNSDDLQAFYAENARRAALATSEFEQRTHGWHFALAPHAAQWAQSHADSDRWSYSGTAIVKLADDAGVILKPEPGHIASAYSHRDSRTEMDTAAGFGFWPDAAQALVVHATTAVPLADLEPPARGDGPAVLALLEKVVDTFAAVHPVSEPPGTPRR